MLTMDTTTETDPMPEGMIDRMLAAVHAELTPETRATQDELLAATLKRYRA